jgi:MFS family permease
MFGACPSILGTGVITDIFFLHERGKAYSTFSLSFLLGTLAGPTLGGFIVQHVSWQVEFWWTIGLQGLVIILGKSIKDPIFPIKRSTY